MMYFCYLYNKQTLKIKMEAKQRMLHKLFFFSYKQAQGSLRIALDQLYYYIWLIFVQVVPRTGAKQGKHRPHPCLQTCKRQPHLILFSVIRINAEVGVALAGEVVDAVLVAGGARPARRVAGARVARVPPHALRTHAVSHYCVRQTVYLFVHFYRFNAAL